MSESHPLTVTLPADLSRRLREAVAEGEYPSVDEALADALSAWANRHEDRADELAWVRAKLRASLADPDPDLSEEEVEARLRAMFRPAGREADAAA